MLRRCALLAAALAAAARAVPAAVVQAPLQDAEGSAGGGVRPSPEIAAYLDFVDAVAAQAQGGQQEGRGAHAPSTAEGLFSAAGDPTPLYNGIATFMHLDNIDCTSSAADGKFDIGVVGMPFDLGVTYRPGARFGPSAARMASRRIAPGTTDMDHDRSAFDDWARVVDCGDVSNTPFDKLRAVAQLTDGARAVLARTPAHAHPDNRAVRMLALGGDHTITLPALRALRPVWGPVAVVHFDAHLDTWDPAGLAGAGSLTDEAAVTHGTMLHLAHAEGLLANASSVHVGSRCALVGRGDLDNDARCGFSYVRARELDALGVEGVVDRIVRRVGDNYVYVSVDIDVLDPAFAPATGTAEPGGLSSRELLRILQALAERGVRIVGADVVELAPMFDTNAEVTALAYVQVAYELLQWMVRVPVQRPETGPLP